MFFLGGVEKHKIKSHLKKLIGPLRVKTTSHIGGLDLLKKKKNSHFLKNPQPRGGEGGVWRCWDGFLTFTSFEL